MKADQAFAKSSSAVPNTLVNRPIDACPHFEAG
jgi:hypothetical protein